jgi:hypothetical protein
MELVPHITLNPSFNIEMLEFIEANDDNRQLIDRNEHVEDLVSRSASLNSINRPNG